MRFSTAEDWDNAGGALEMMILTLMSTRPTSENEADLEIALDALENAKSALKRLGVFSKDFDPLLYHY